MPNPVFNEKSMQEAQTGWAAPVAGTHVATQPVTDGPVTSWQKAMTVNGTITASAVLLVILLVSASFGWNAADGPTTVQGVETYQFPALGFLGIVVGFIAVIVAMRKPLLAKYLGPVYAIGYGFAVGAISKGYETFYDGIVLQAVLATASVFAVMLVLYRTRIIKVTDKFRRTVIFATLGVMVLYLGSWIFSLFGGTIPFLNGDNRLFSILFSVFVCGLAAMNLALDFDLIERGTKTGMPQAYEWVAALGLVVTLVWLYLEILRLLSYLPQLTNWPIMRGDNGVVAEAVGVGAVGATFGAIVGVPFGLSIPFGVVGGANGLISGSRGVYDWSHRRGPLAFLLDSTWALPMTAAGLFAQAVGLATDGEYVAEMSERANRHVYRKGFTPRRGFAITLGNVISGAGDTAEPRRRRLVNDHEDVHVWQARWLGPLYPILYGGWTVVGGAAGIAVWVRRGRREPLARVVETCGYYLNPFEWWAYSRDDFWPPAGKIREIGWKRPMVRSFRAVRGG